MYPQVISWMDVDSGNPDYNPDDSQFKRRYLAEGDSWFSLRGFPTSNIPINLNLPYSSIIVSCAEPGDTIRSMGKMLRSGGFNKMTGRLGYAWDAILLSGGGNDLIDDAKRIIKPLPAGQTSSDPIAYCDQEALTSTLSTVSNGYIQIAAKRDRAVSSCPGCKMVAHTYAWATPRNAPARFIGFPIRGPWLYPALVKAKVPESLWNDVSDHLIRALGNEIVGLKMQISNFHVAETQDALNRAVLGSTLIGNDWADEIHPTQKGYEKLAKLIRPLLL